MVETCKHARSFTFGRILTLCFEQGRLGFVLTAQVATVWPSIYFKHVLKSVSELGWNWYEFLYSSFLKWPQVCLRGK